MSPAVAAPRRTNSCLLLLPLCLPGIAISSPDNLLLEPSDSGTAYKHGRRSEERLVRVSRRRRPGQIPRPRDALLDGHPPRRTACEPGGEGAPVKWEPSSDVTTKVLAL